MPCKSKTPVARKLHDPNIFVRIRPKSSSGGHADETAVEKQLDGWTSDTIALKDRHATTEYDFPQAVLPPDISQKKTYDTMMSPLVSSFLDGYNVVFFAYGQTGTGKTHTMFGTKLSLESHTSHPDWGVFPRIACAVFQKMSLESKIAYTLEGCAIEYYLTSSYDLLNSRKPLVADINNKPVGMKMMSLENEKDVMKYLEIARGSRTSRGTRMNEASEEHEGSSRSHCALILSLSQLDRQTNTYQNSIFNLVDLAGAERPGKNGSERASAHDVIMEMYLGKEISTGSQAFLINFELSQLCSEVEQAKKSHRLKKKYTPGRQLLTPFVQFLCNCFDGTYIVGMIICLSQSLNCGWETWFSMQYGTKLSKLRVPRIKSKRILIDNAMSKTVKELEEAREALRRTPSPETGAPASKYYERRRVAVISARDKLSQLQRLKDASS